MAGAQQLPCMCTPQLLMVRVFLLQIQVSWWFIKCINFMSHIITRWKLSQQLPKTVSNQGLEGVDASLIVRPWERGKRAEVNPLDLFCWLVIGRVVVDGCQWKANASLMRMIHIIWWFHNDISLLCDHKMNLWATPAVGMEHFHTSGCAWIRYL